MTDLVVNLGLELDSGLDDINGSQGTVGNGTTKSTSKCEPEVSDISHLTFVGNTFMIQHRTCQRNIPGVEIKAGRGRLSGSLDGLLGVLDLVVGLA